MIGSDGLEVGVQGDSNATGGSRFFIPPQPDSTDSAIIELFKNEIGLEPNAAQSVLDTMRTQTNNPPWIISREMLPQSDGTSLLLVIIDVQLLRQTLQQPEEPPQQQEGILETIWGGLIGEFNPNPSLGSIGIDFATSIIPGVDQIADLRDLMAHLYYLVIKGEYSQPLRWVGLGFTLIGLVPLLGSAIKSASKVLYNKGAAEIVNNLGELLEPIRQVLPEIGEVRALQDLINRSWNNWASFGQKKWSEIVNNLYAKVDSIPDILLGGNKNVLLEAIKRVQQESGALTRAFDEIRRKIDEGLDEIGRLLNPNGELVTPEGVRVPSDEGINGPRRIEGTGGSPNPRNTRFLNVEEAREFIAQKIASGESLTLDLFGGRISQIPGAINIDMIAEEGIRATIADLVRIFPDNSVDEIIASGPQAEFLEEAARVLKPRGRIYINANFSNRYRFGTRTGKKPPDSETLERLRLRIVQDDGSIEPRFANLEFRRTDGNQIPIETVRTVIFEKLE
ncbi:MAG TPA: hypothetical protein DCY91_30775 [Cyanobacteria bacterium UBA11370]|nr:hypothetical protein [Cyanobacteria bacterium UBA11370]